MSNWKHEVTENSWRHEARTLLSYYNLRWTTMDTFGHHSRDTK